MIRKKEGFTLVELLVVIAIIIILAAVLFPVFAKARESAQKTRCLNNLKQMAAAIEMYEDDYGAAIMPYATKPNFWGYYWQDLLDPYIQQLKNAVGGTYTGQGELLTCPSAPKEAAVGGKGWMVGKTYGYNIYLNSRIRVSQVKYPAVTLRLAECSNQNPDLPPHPIDNPYWGGSWFAPLPDGASAGYQFEIFAPGWHNGMSTVLWVDGHVSIITRQRVMLRDDNFSGDIDGNVWCRLAPKPGYTAE